MNGTRPALALAAVLIASAALVLPGLGATALWQDEGQTAVVAKNVLATGLPRASDGHNTVSLFADRRDVRDGIYIWQPWLPNYLAAASMAIFGTTTFGARLPFALCHLLLVFAVCRFAMRWRNDPWSAWLATALTAASVTMLLHARQCRYYAPAALLALLAVDGYLRLRRGDGGPAVVRLVAAATLLFNTFPPAAVFLAVALGIDAVWPGRRERRFKELGLAIALIVALNLAPALFMRIWDRRFGVQPGYSDAGVFLAYLARYVASLNLFFFPVVAALAAAALRWRALSAGTVLRDPFTRVLLLAAACPLVGFAALSDYPFTRYLVTAAPFVFLLGGRCLAVLSGRRVATAAALVALTAGTNLLALPPLLPLRATETGKTPWSRAGIDARLLEANDVGGSFARGELGLLVRTPAGSPLVDYLGELLDPPRGPIDALVAWFDENAEPDDTVYVGYGDLALMFYLPQAVRGKVSPDVAAPEYYVPRHHNPIHPQRLAQQGVQRPRYDPVVLGVPDYQWNNPPDPLYHRFSDELTEKPPELVVFKRRPASP